MDDNLEGNNESMEILNKSDLKIKTNQSIALDQIHVNVYK